MAVGWIVENRESFSYILKEREEMLESKDLQAIAELIDFRITKTENRFDEKMDALDKKVDVLDKRVDALDKKVDVLNKRVDALDKRMDTLDKRVDVLDGRMSEVERNLIDELARTEDIFVRRFDKVEKNLEELNQYYRIDKLENGNIALMLHTMEEYHKRLKALEVKIA